jgi:hypothetical protein
VPHSPCPGVSTGGERKSFRRNVFSEELWEDEKNKQLDAKTTVRTRVKITVTRWCDSRPLRPALLPFLITRRVRKCIYIYGVHKEEIIQYIPLSAMRWLQRRRAGRRDRLLMKSFKCMIVGTHALVGTTINLAKCP